MQVQPCEFSRSLVIPIYRNEENLPRLFVALDTLADKFGEDFEVVFVVDGSPDKSYEAIRARMDSSPFAVQLVNLSRNFGAFTAIRTGMSYARGEVIAVMAADLQEPISLIENFFNLLGKDAADVVFGQRAERNDPPLRKFFANSYWTLYRKLVNSDIPKGGVDVFACNKKVKEALLDIEEPNSSLVAQLFWVGFRRLFVPYERQQRLEGESAWNFQKRLRYMVDSIVSFSDFPIMVVLWLGLTGIALSTVVGAITLVSKLLGWIDVQGYTGIVIILLFFGSALLTTQGIVGCYLWRTFENTKRRPLSIVQSTIETGGNRDVHS
jgi:glycosyltransferase involved in cell wall biosynthesis